MKLSPCETITDEKKFVESHKAIIEAYESRMKEGEDNRHIKRLVEPYKMRLEKYYELSNK